MNDFDKEKFLATANSFVQNPKTGMTPFHANLKWQDGIHCQVKIRDFAPLLVDEPFELGGKNRGPNPVEYLITGVVSCFSIVVLIKSNLDGVKINSLETELDANLDLSAMVDAVVGGRHGIGDVTLTLHIDADAPKAKLEEIAGYALKYSPSLNSVNIPVRVIAGKK